MSEIVYEEKKVNGVGIAALVCGCVGFVFNPFSLVVWAAIILGIVGLALPNRPKGMALAGLITGICALVLQFILDLVLSVISAGLGSFLFLI